MSAWVMIHNNSGSALNPLSFLFFVAWNSSGSDKEPAMSGDQITATDTWYQLSVQFNSAIDATHIAIELAPSPNNWSGTVYIDGVTLTPL